MSWSEAQSYCRENNTDLATVGSQEVAEQLLNIIGDSLSDTAWIGLYCDDTQNWQWSNSDDVIYSNWKAELFCASVTSSGEWRDLRCQEKYPFMCYKETSNITESYTLIGELKTWTEAQQYCREHHTDLVSIKSASENEDLVKKAQGKTFWIGLFNNPWKWSHHGDNYTFHSWYKGKSSNEPNNESGNEKCVVMNEKGDWYDSSCSSKFLFVCCSVVAFSPGGSSGNCILEGTEKTWHEAQSYCRNHNKDLVTIQDQDRMKNILDIIAGKSTWIGLHRDKENWQWSNGGDVIYSNWRSQLFCASVNSSGVWNESLCKEKNPFMCYNGFFVPFSNQIRRYYYENTLMSWSDAQSYCRENNTDLVTMHSQEEAEQLLNLTGDSLNDTAWIGLYRDDTQNWQWSNSDDVIYSNWRAELFCASVSSTGEWEDRVCNEKKAFMCYTETSNITARYTLFEDLKTWTENLAIERRMRSIACKSRVRIQAIPLPIVDGSSQGAAHNWPSVARGEGGFGFFVPFSNQIRRYYYENTLMSWSDAQSYCREKHTDLVTMHSQEEAEQLLNLTGDSLNDTAWIGLYRDDTQNWQWSNSDDVIYSNWRAELFCASVSSTGEWEDRVCNEKKAFMCYTETSNITARYTLFEDLKTWTEAQQYCREHHTDLVSINSDSENEDLVKKAQGKPFWIGLFNNPWKWSHQGDNYTFQNWANGDPNNESGNEKCVVMNEIDAFSPGGSSGNCSLEGTEKTWHEAQSYCRNHNKDLVTIQDQDRMKNILDIIAGKSTWIGLHRDKENWQWSNGGDVIYSNWTSQLFCASVSSSGVWDESLCKEKKPFMCYNETSNIAERYTLLEELKNWTEAQQYCREHHTDLVSYHVNNCANRRFNNC
ncbi:UNVERIFIED_CONTAM: hypothetical protein FKN15_058926 [Acipenser sinensis]